MNELLLILKRVGVHNSFDKNEKKLISIYNYILTEYDSLKIKKKSPYAF